MAGFSFRDERGDYTQYDGTGEITGMSIRDENGTYTSHNFKEMAHDIVQEAFAEVEYNAQVANGTIVPVQTTQGSAIFAFVMSFVSLVLCWTFIIPLVGLIVSVVALGNYNRAHHTPTSKVFGIIGLIANGLITLVVGAIYVTVLRG